MSLLGIVALLLLVLGASLSEATIYSYGPSDVAALQAFAYSNSEPKLANGDIIELQPGTYDLPVLTQSIPTGSHIALWLRNRGAANANITIRGALDQPHPVLKFASNLTIGFMLTDQTNVRWTIQHLHLYGINDGTDNTFNTDYCFFHRAYNTILTDVIIQNCETGMNTHDSESGSITIEYSEVFECGMGLLSHQLYASTELTNPDVVFTLTHTYLHSPKGGNGIKSRFPSNYIAYNWVNHSGSGVYRPLEMIGGQGVLNPPLGQSQSNVVGNVFIKSDTGPNYALARIGYDGTGNSRGRYRIVANTFIGSTTQKTGFIVWGEVHSASFYDNIFYLPGSNSIIFRLDPDNYDGTTPTLYASNNWIPTGTNVTVFTAQGLTFASVTGTDPGFNSFATADLFLATSSSCVGKGIDPPPNPNLDNQLVLGDTIITSVPMAEKIAPGTVSNLRPNGAQDIGAFNVLGATAPPSYSTALASATATASLASTSTTTTTAASSSSSSEGCALVASAVMALLTTL